MFNNIININSNKKRITKMFNFMFDILTFLDLIPSFLDFEEEELYSGKWFSKDHKYTGDEFNIYDYSVIE